MAAALSLVTSKTATLYAIEDHLAVLIDTEAQIPPEKEAEFLREFSAALDAAADARDGLGRFLAHLESQIHFAKVEIERLQARKRGFERASELAEHYVVRTMEALGKKKLEGHTVTLSLRACPPSVELRDELAVPVSYKRISVTLPAAIYDQVLDSLDVETAAVLLDAGGNLSVDKLAIKAAIEAGHDVPGAALARRKSLVRK
jgi:hypothetical protein